MSVERDDATWLGLGALSVVGVVGLFLYPALSGDEACSGTIGRHDPVYWLLSLGIVVLLEVSTVRSTKRLVSSRLATVLLIVGAQLPIAGVWLAAAVHHAFTICF